MDNPTYREIESYMLEAMRDSAHDEQHVYRVLRSAVRLAESYPEANRDVLIAACLLHDVGREAQFKDPMLCHAVLGGKMAYKFLKGMGWDESAARHVRDCITTHRFRADNQPGTIEAKLLFDADKLDCTGAIGIARTLFYEGQVGEPLYSVDRTGRLDDGRDQGSPESFLKEYHFKLKRLYKLFYTEEARAIAESRKKTTKKFHKALLEELTGGETFTIPFLLFPNS